MGYNRDVPGAAQSLSRSQIKMRANSFLVDDIFGQEHYKFSDPVNGGKHRKITMPQQGSSPTTLSDEYALFVRDVAGDKFISVRPESNGTVGDLIDSGDSFNSVRVGDLKIGAECIFDRNAQIISQFNVSSIDHVANSGAYTVNFTSSIPTADYFWSLSYMNSPLNEPALPTAVFNQRPGMYVTPDATYGNSISTDFIKLVVLGSVTIGAITYQLEKYKTKLQLRVWYLP